MVPNSSEKKNQYIDAFTHNGKATSLSLILGEHQDYLFIFFN